MNEEQFGDNRPSSRYPFYCIDCGSFDRRNHARGGCRYFDTRPDVAASGIDPPCALYEEDEEPSYGAFFAGALALVAIALGVIWLIARMGP